MIIFNCNRYDALTTSNKVSYQNALNVENITFAKACGSVLTNYCWKEKDAASSVTEAFQEGLPLQQVYFGIDVWAQNVTKLSQPRVTYPEYGGGGTNTGVAIAKLAEFGLSVGIFAPAWTFEHFPGHGRDMEGTMWTGQDLPKAVVCSCGDCETRHRSNAVVPVSSFAKLADAGSERFFFTDFSRAFCSHGGKERDVLFHGYPLHAQLGSQSILPLFSGGSSGALSTLRHRVEAVEGRSQLVIETCGLPSVRKSGIAVSKNCSQSIPLYKLNMPADGSLQLRISYRDLSDAPQVTYFYMKVSGTTRRLVQLDEDRIDRLINVVVESSDTASKTSSRLEEIGFHSQASSAGVDRRLAEVDYLCIQPVGSHPCRPPNIGYKHDMSQPNSLLDGLTDVPRQSHSIYDIRQKFCDGETKHTRLRWSHTSNVEPIQGMPHSTITGSFSYFAIYLDGMFLGRAYAAEHELPPSFVQQSAERKVLVYIKGVGFDGQELASASTEIQV